MEKINSKQMLFVSNYWLKPLIMAKLCVLLLLCSITSVSADAVLTEDVNTRVTTSVINNLEGDQSYNVTGTVTDATTGEAMPGVTVIIKGTRIGVNTDVNGKFALKLLDREAVLLISFIGYTTQEISVTSNSDVKIKMVTALKQIDEVVIVGYGAQKRESIVGAITNTTNETLEKRGGVVNLAEALSGQLPGVMVMDRTGEPGREDPAIMIRGKSTWNGATPLILVDGVERRMNDINVNEVESVSILKDASATAVFGVKGANGVILITTKRGELGKPKLSVSANVGVKDISKIFTLEEAFTAQNWKNAAIEHEVASNEIAWQYYLPYEQVLRSKKPQQYPYLYPNVDWVAEVTKPFATNKAVNMNVTGGTEFAKYFASIAYSNEGDILKSGKNDKGYNPEYSYNRLNFRGNLDFELTKTTKLSTNVSGYATMKKETMAYANNWIFQSLYTLPPDAFPVRYEDGLYGKDPADVNLHNPLAILNEAGLKKTNRLFIGTDLKLEQKLDFITKGLSASANLSYDNTFGSSGPDITDIGNQGQTLYKFIYPSILDARTHSDSLNAVVLIPSVGASAVNEYDFVLRPWTIASPSVNNGVLERTLYYQLSLNYSRKFELHDVTGLFLFSRRQNATGADFPNYQENWVSRITYAYDRRYFADINGAYNGSEKFGPGYRFGFFPSLGLGWMVSNESFMKKYAWISKLKLRGSIGKVGSDTGIPRWGYLGSWASGTYASTRANALFGNTNGIINPITAMDSPYTYYWEGTIPNPNINWETAVKKNIGFEFSFLKGLITFEGDFFKDNRKNIFMGASSRNIPSYFGAEAVPINLGKTETKGMELDLVFRKRTHSGFEYWFRQTITRAKDVVLQAEDPKLRDAYLNTVGFPIGQTKSQIQDGSIASNWDEVYAQTSQDNNIRKLTGDWGIIDFNGDGKINSFDSTPYGYPNDRPGNTYSTYVGLEYKNFSFSVQFYGVTNITQYVGLASPAATRKSALSSYLVDYWSIDNQDAKFKAPRLTTGSPWGQYQQFDGSYLRLKTMEISYNLPNNLTKSLGIANARLYINGNNLLYWSDLPMDNESGSFDVYNSYPTYRLVNMGIDLVF